MEDDEDPLYDRESWMGGDTYEDDHDWVVKMVIQSGRYDIEGVEIFTNIHGERNRSAGKIGNEEEEQYPDIVGVDIEKDEPVIIAEIESKKTVKEKYVEKWKKYASLGIDFYMYVPIEKVADAKRLLKNIEIKGLRAYRATEDGKFYISNVTIEKVDTPKKDTSRTPLVR
jgi:hypothetical protein